MLSKLALNVFKKSWPSLVICALAAFVAWQIAWHQGFREGIGDSRTAQEAIRRLQEQVNGFETDKRHAAEQNARQLATALADKTAQQKRADTASYQLRQKQAELNRMRREQKQRSQDAVTNDGDHFNGIGPDSLREYAASLGYAADSHGQLPAHTADAAGHTGETTRTGTGLSPDDLLSHAADYGAWCLKLENQMKAIGNWSEGER